MIVLFYQTSIFVKKTWMRLCKSVLKDKVKKLERFFVLTFKENKGFENLQTNTFLKKSLTNKQIFREFYKQGGGQWSKNFKKKFCMYLLRAIIRYREE